MNMPITSSTTKEIWIMTTGLLAAGVLSSAVGDLITSSGSIGSPVFYALVAALSLAARVRLGFGGGSRLVSAAGISSAGIAGFALADIFSPGASAELIDASGPYLLLGTWLLGIDTVYREIEISRLRNKPEITAGE
jgi:hypothetical protein